MNSLTFLIETLFDLYLIVVLLRVWLQLARADFYNPLSQFVVKATHPIVGPMRRIIPSFGRLDTATLVLAFGVAILKMFLLGLVIGQGIDPIQLLVSALFTMLSQAYWLVMGVLIIRVILSWIAQGNNPIEFLLSSLTEPMLAPIRRVIPPMGGFDLSVLVLIILLQFIPILANDLLRLF